MPRPPPGSAGAAGSSATSNSALVVLGAFVFVILTEVWLQLGAASAHGLARRADSDEAHVVARLDENNVTDLRNVSVTSAEEAMQQAGISHEAAAASLSWIARYKDTYEKALQRMTAEQHDPCEGLKDVQRRNCLSRLVRRKQAQQQHERELTLGREAYAQYSKASQYAASTDVEGAKFVQELQQRSADRGHVPYRVLPTLVRDRKGVLQPGVAATRFDPGSADHVARTGFTWHPGDPSGAFAARAGAAGLNRADGKTIFNKLKPWQLAGPNVRGHGHGRRRALLRGGDTSDGM